MVLTTSLHRRNGSIAVLEIRNHQSAACNVINSSINSGAMLSQRIFKSCSYEGRFLEQMIQAISITSRLLFFWVRYVHNTLFERKWNEAASCTCFSVDPSLPCLYLGLYCTVTNWLHTTCLLRSSLLGSSGLTGKLT